MSHTGHLSESLIQFTLVPQCVEDAAEKLHEFYFSVVVEY